MGLARKKPKLYGMFAENTEFFKGGIRATGAITTIGSLLLRGFRGQNKEHKKEPLHPQKYVKQVSTSLAQPY
jgi:hypothetical protein